MLTECRKNVEADHFRAMSWHRIVRFPSYRKKKHSRDKWSPWSHLLWVISGFLIMCHIICHCVAACKVPVSLWGGFRDKCIKFCSLLSQSFRLFMFFFLFLYLKVIEKQSGKRSKGSSCLFAHKTDKIMNSSNNSSLKTWVTPLRNLQSLKKRRYFYNIYH